MSIDESLLNRVRATFATVSRQRDQFRSTEPLVVPVAAEVDIATAPQLRADVDAALASGVPVVCIDLSATTFVDSSALHVLVDAVHLARDRGTELTIACPRSNIRRVIEIAGVGELLPLTDEPVA